MMAAANDFYDVGSTVTTTQPAPGLLANDTGGVVVSQLNGNAAAIGAPTPIPSGATVTVNSDGSFSYNPTTSPTLGTLPANTQGTDSFSYSTTLFTGTLGQWSFPTAAAVDTFVSTGPNFDPTTTASGVTVSPITKSADANVRMGSENPTPAYPTPVLRVDPGTGSANIAAAVTGNRYFQFTVSAAPGNTLDLSSLTFNAARGGGTTPRGWGVRTSVDGFGTNLATADLATQRPTLAAINIPLTAAAFQNLSTITFRVYVYAPAGGATMEFDDFTVAGSVEQTATANFTVFSPIVSPTYIDDAWTGMLGGTSITDVDPVAPGNQPGVFGTNAFASVNTAIATVPTVGPFVVNAGTYNEAVLLPRALYFRLQEGPITFSSLDDSVSTVSIRLDGVPLTVGGNGANTQIDSPITGNGSILKTGGGTMTLAGANSYSGGTTVTGGTIRLSLATGLGSGPTIVNDTAVLEINNIAHNGAVTLNNGATLRGLGTSARENGTITIPSSASVNLATGGSTTDTLTLGDAANDLVAGANAVLNVNGAGAVVLTSDNSTGIANTARWNVTGGAILSIPQDLALGAVPAGVTSNYLALDGSTLRATATTTLATNRGITLAGSGGTIDVAAGGFTVNSQFSGFVPFTKSGATDLILGTPAAANQFTSVNITGGRLFFPNSANSLGSGPITIRTGGSLNYSTTGSDFTLANPITMEAGANLASRRSGGTLTLSGQLFLPSTGTVIFNLDDQPTGTINTTNASNNLFMASDMTFQVGTNNATVGQMNLNHSISGAGLVKTGTGSLQLSSTTSSYSGDTTILNGQIFVTNNIAPSTNGNLGNSANPIIIGDTSGTNGAGLLTNGGGAVAITRDVLIRAGSTGVKRLGTQSNQAGSISSNIALNDHLTFQVNQNTFTVNSLLADSGGSRNITKTLTGSVLLANVNNSYTGTTSVLAGTLLLGGDAPNGGNSVVGNSGAPILLGNTTGTDTAAILTNGAFTLNRAITVQAGSTGAKAIGGNSASSSTINSSLTLNDHLTVRQNSTGTVTINSLIQDFGGSRALTKDGTGNVFLPSANPYTGITTISAGALQVGTPGAVGTGSYTQVLSGGTLELRGPVTGFTEPLLILGPGANNLGAINSTGANNTLLSSITLMGSAAIGSGTAGNKLTLSGNLLLGPNDAVTFTGAGNIDVPNSFGNGNAPYLPANALSQFGYHDAANVDTLLDLNNNGGLLNSLNPSAAAGFFKSTVLTFGPGLRGLDFNDDNDFLGTGAIGQADNYSSLFVGYLRITSANAGTWSFRQAGEDDRFGVWVDLDNDGLLESTTAGLGDNRGEQVSWENATLRNVTLSTNGDGTPRDYLVAFTHREITGGSVARMRITPPGGTEVAVRPGDPAQAGWWKPLQTITPNNGVIKTGTGTVTFLTANTYNGPTNIYGGTLQINDAGALGASAAAQGTTVGPGGTLALNGVNLSGESLTLNGIGAAGQGGALINTGAGSSSYTGNIVADLAINGQFGIGASGGLLTVNGTINMLASQLVLGGSGNTVVNSTISGLGGTQNVAGGLTAKFYNVAGAATLLDPATGLNLPLEALTPAATVVTPRIDFGTGTDLLPGDGSVIDRAGLDGNLLGGVGVSIGNDNISGLWTGFLNAPETATYVFTVRNDDGARVWVDITGDGDFDDAGELVATRPAAGGVANTTGTPVTLSAGPHAFKAAWYEGTGGAGMQVSWQQTSGASPFARRNIEPTAFSTPLTSNNSVVKSGTGTATLAGNNTYNGTTTVSGGTLIVAHDNGLGSASAGTSVGSGATLALSGNVSVGFESINLSATGTLRSASGSNSVAGPVTIVPLPPIYAQIDIGPSNQRGETGFTKVGVAADGANGANLVTTPLTSLSGDAFTIAINNVDQTNVATTAGIDWRVRGQTAPLQPLVQLGEDQIKNNDGVIRVTLGSIPAGTYTLTSYHANGNGSSNSLHIDVYVNTGSGFALATPPGTFGASNYPGTAAAMTTANVDNTKSIVTFTADGTNDVVVVYDGRSFTTDRETDLNGFVLSALNPSSTANVDAALGASLALSGGISGSSASLAKIGLGTVALGGFNSYDGTTSVNAGTLLVNGLLTDGTTATDVSVAAGATLGGTGQINGTVVLAATAILAPGANGPGTLLAPSTVSLAAGSTFAVEINGDNAGDGFGFYDQLATSIAPNVTGVILSPNYINTGANPYPSSASPSPTGINVGDVYVILDNQSGSQVTGRFVNASSVVYNEGDIVPLAGLPATMKAVISYVQSGPSGGGNDIAILIQASNTPATISFNGAQDQNVTEAGGVGNATPGDPSASGDLNIVDPDPGQAVFQTPATLNKTYGTFTFNTTNGNWSYALDNARAATQALIAAQVVTDSLTVTSFDGTANFIITVTVTGANDAAAITFNGAQDQSVTEAGGVANGTPGDPSASGDVDVIDVDAGQNSFLAPGSLGGTYGTFTFNAANGNWSYALDNARAATQALIAGQTVTDTLNIASADGTSFAINVTVTGSNDAASITFNGAQDQNVTEAGGVNNAVPGDPSAGGDLDVIDIDAGQSAFQTPASLNGTYGTFAFNAANGNWSYTLDNARSATQALIAGQTMADTLTILAQDGTSFSLSVTVTGANDAPIAKINNATGTPAGTSSAVPGQAVPFNFSWTDLDGPTASATYTIKNSSNVVILVPTPVTNPNVLLTFPSAGAFTVTLTVSDGISIGVATWAVTVNRLVIDSSGNLVFGGDDAGNDRIAVSGSNGVVSITHSVNNGPATKYSLPLASSSKVIVFGLGRDDDMRAAANLGYAVEFHGGAGNDYLAGGGLGDSLFGDDGNDRMLAGAGDDYLDGGLGNDSADGGAGNDQIFGGDGTDTLVGNAGDDRLYGGLGNDGLSGGTGMDYLEGQDGNDTLNGGTEADILLGGAGNDRLQAGGGLDFLVGGAGLDMMQGEGDDDILVGDDVTMVDRYAESLAIRNAWMSGSPVYSTRVADMQALLSVADIVSDGQVESLVGASGLDWFLTASNDKVVSPSAGERTN